MYQSALSLCKKDLSPLRTSRLSAGEYCVY